MSYNSVSQFRQRAFPSGSFSDIPDSTIQYELDVGASMVDAALRPHHSLPMNTGSYATELALVYDAEITIASYQLMQHRGFKANFAGDIDDGLRQRYADIVDPENGLLARLATGRIVLPSESDNTPHTTERRSRMWGKSGRTFRVFDSNGNEIV